MDTSVQRSAVSIQPSAFRDEPSATGSQLSVLGSQFSPNTHHPTPNTRHSSLITHHSSQPAKHSALSTQHSALLAFTLAEIMIAIAIIAILVGIVAWMGSRSNADAKVKQTKAAMDAIRAAVTEFKLAGHGMPSQPFDPDDITPPDITLIGLFAGDRTFRADFYRERSGTEGDFVLDANGDSADGPAEGDTGRFAYSVRPENHKVPDGRRIYGIQVLYYELMKEPNSRAMVNKIPSAHVISADKVAPGTEFLNPGTLMRKGNPADDQRATDVLVFVDAWGRPLYYQRSTPENNDEWSVRSAGPDGQWGTGDDIFSYK